MEGTLQRHQPTEGRGIREGAIIVVVVVVVDGDNNDKGTGRQVQGQGMERPSLLSDLLPRWTEDDQGNRGGRGRRNPPLGSRHRRGVGDLNPMLASLTWMSFTTTVPLTGSCSGTSEQTNHLPGGRRYPLPICFFMLVSLMWMSFTTTVPLTMGVVLGHLNRHIVYLEDAAIPSRFAFSG